MTAAQAILAPRVIPAQTTGRAGANGDDVVSADGGAADEAFSDLLDISAATPDQEQATPRIRGAGDDPRVQREPEAGDAAPSPDVASLAPMQQAALALASLAAAAPPAAPIETSQPPSVEESAEAILARMLNVGPVERESAGDGEVDVPDDKDVVVFMTPDDAEAMKVSIEETPIVARGIERYLAVSRPVAEHVAAKIDTKAASAAELSPDVRDPSAAPLPAELKTQQPETQSSDRAPLADAKIATEMPAVRAKPEQRGGDIRDDGRAQVPRELPVAVGPKSEMPNAGADSSDQEALGQGGTNGSRVVSRQDDGGQQSFGTAMQAAGSTAGRIDASAASSAELSPADQIAQRVTADIGNGPVMASSDGDVKVLHIELKPENLGTVTVRISLKDDAVSLHLEAQRPETAAAIERERDQLSQVLKQAGYLVDGITTQQADTRAVGRVDAAQSSAPFSSSGQSQGQSLDQGLSNPSGQGGGQRNQRSGDDRAAARYVTDTMSGVSQERKGELYV